MTLALAIALTLSTGLPASAEEIAWGPQGEVGASPSAVTLRWDNAGNSALSTVDRADSAPLPHTAGKTVSDINPQLRQSYKDAFANLSVSVSQTKSMAAQTINVTVDGHKGPTGNLGDYVQFFQCWGALKNGKPDPTATSPDPETCQVGVGGSDRISRSTEFDYSSRFVTPDDELLKDGDWDKSLPDKSSPRVGGALRPAPFRSIDGSLHRNEIPRSSEFAGNPFFNAATTNEISNLYFDGEKAVTRTMEIQTGTEASGLGCGKSNDGKPSTPSCWLVAVPRLESQAESKGGLVERPGPVSPSIWAQRLQVKLSFLDRSIGCNAGDAPIQVSGSEQSAGLMASWIPQICAESSKAFAFNPIGETQVRGTFGTDLGSMMFGTDPITESPTVNAPIALTGLVIAYTIDSKLPDGSFGGPPIRNLKLNARLVAKLLTQSYLNGIDNSAGNELPKKAPWSKRLGVDLAQDPEFIKLNPGLSMPYVVNFGGDLLAENLGSDAARQLWSWLLNDPGASSFLSGCPDSKGSFINPFFPLGPTRAARQIKLSSTPLQKRKSVPPRLHKIFTTSSPTTQMPAIRSLLGTNGQRFWTARARY